MGVPSGSSVTGFNGWIDDFKVIAHEVDFETACNYAGGSLIGLQSTYAGVWKRKLANLLPAWVQKDQPGAKEGLDPDALTLDTTFTTATDPRRQPFQPSQKIFGRIPAGLVDSTGLPSTTTDLGASGGYIDNWLLSSYANNAAPKTLTLIDANTHAELMTLASGATVDPARLGTKNLTIRANLSTAQGSATLSYDGSSNTKTKLPYTSFGSDAHPRTGATLVPGAHAITATSQSGSSLTVNFSVAGNTARVVAGYRTDFRAGSPAPGWSYWWNAGGPITDPGNYVGLNWSPTVNKYSVNGFPVSPDNSSTLFPYGGLTSVGGHPGRGSTQGATYDRYPIAAYTAKISGYYAITSSFVTSGDSRANGGQVMVFTQTANGSGGTTFTQKFSGLYTGGGTLHFDQNVGLLNAGDTIYVAVGPNTVDSYDTFTMDFNISYLETGNPM